MPEAIKPGQQDDTKKIFIALDFDSVARAKALVAQLSTVPMGQIELGFKIGSELVLAGGQELIREIRSNGQEVFLDCKFYDIPNTVSKTAKAAANLGVNYFTLHLSGGREMIESTREALANFSDPPKILGVTALTSFDQNSWSEIWSTYEVAKPLSLAGVIESLVKNGVSWGVDGFICSPFEIESTRKIAPELEIVTPGIRPPGAESGDQKRVMTPMEAFNLGANAIVVGRPITLATDPILALSSLISVLQN